MRISPIAILSLLSLFPLFSWGQTTQPAEKPMTDQEKKAAAEKLRALCKADIDLFLKTDLTKKEILGVLGKIRDAHLAQWKAADQLGLSDGALLLGLSYCYGSGGEPDYKKAFDLFRKSAEAGDAFGMEELGCLYQRGRGVEKNLGEAVKWFHKSADAGFPCGMSNLAGMYKSGLGVEKDLAEAVKWARKSVEAGSTDGMLILGDMYMDGQGIQKDLAEAVKWYRKATEAGNSNGMNSLAWMYQCGLGVVKDDKEALKWYRKVAHRRLGCDHGDVAAAGGRAGGARARFDDTDHRQRAEPGLHCIQPHRGSGIAGHHQALDAVPRQRLGRLPRIARHGVGRLGAIRQSRRVTEVHEALMRQRLHQRRQHRQPADAGVEHADGRIRQRAGDGMAPAGTFSPPGAAAGRRSRRGWRENR